MDSNRNFDGLSPHELNRLYKDFLFQYSAKGNSPEKKQTIASQIEAIFMTAARQEYVGAARQLANIYAGEPLYTYDLGNWVGLYRIPELADTTKAVACIEKHDRDPEYWTQRYLAKAYAGTAPEKLDQLTSNGREAHKLIDLQACFDRAKQIHDGNTRNDVNTSLTALHYLTSFFLEVIDKKGVIDKKDKDLSLRCHSVDLLLDIADRQGVLRKAFYRVGTHLQEGGTPTPRELHQIIFNQVFSTDVGRSPAPQP